MITADDVQEMAYLLLHLVRAAEQARASREEHMKTHVDNEKGASV